MEIGKGKLATKKPFHAEKRKYRSASEDPEDTFLALKRVKKTINLVLEFSCKSPSTQFFPRPFNRPDLIKFSIPLANKTNLSPQQACLTPIEVQNFQEANNKLQSVIETIIGPKKSKKTSQRKLTSEEEKLLNLETYLSLGITDLKYLVKMTKLSLPTIKNSLKKFQRNERLVKDCRGKKKVLNDQHQEFIQNFYKNQNFDKSVIDLHSALLKKFDLKENFISHWTLYKY